MFYNWYFDNCLKLRHFFHWGLTSFLLLMIVSCGVKSNRKVDQDKQDAINAFFMLDSQCNTNTATKSQVYTDIQNFYSKAMFSNVIFKGSWMDENRFYFLKPMIVNEGILIDKLEKLETEFKNGLVDIKQLMELVEMANRYEGQKCNFKGLIEKKNTDLTSYLNLLHQCVKKSNGDCNEDVLASILNNNSEEDVINLCSQFKRVYQCKLEYDSSKRSKTLDKMAKYYMDEVDQQKFQSLFKMRDKHTTYKCEKTNELVNMEIRVYNDGFEGFLFNKIIAQISNVWSKNQLKLNIVTVEYGSEYDLKITAVTNQISHVQNNDLSAIYLDKNLDSINLSNVAAHEFGHILGFPDCYIEYFDSVKNALVYYELSPESNNIMCSLKSGFKVESQYIDQIVQKTCKF